MVRLADLQDIIKNQTKLIRDQEKVIDDQRTFIDGQQKAIEKQTLAIQDQNDVNERKIMFSEACASHSVHRGCQDPLEVDLL